MAVLDGCFLLELHARAEDTVLDSAVVPDNDVIHEHRIDNLGVLTQPAAISQHGTLDTALVPDEAIFSDNAAGRDRRLVAERRAGCYNVVVFGRPETRQVKSNAGISNLGLTGAPCETCMGD